MGRTTWFDVDGLRKGEWTAEEDRKLVVYINEHGLGEWGSLPKRAGTNLYLHLCYIHCVRSILCFVSLWKLGALKKLRIFRFQFLSDHRFCFENVHNSLFMHKKSIF